MKELEAELHLLKSNNATLKMNYKEEAFESEAAKSRLNEALTRLDNLQTNFDQNVTCIENLKHAKNQIEMKHVKTCNEVKKYKDDVEDLKTELSQASVMIKTLKKEAKEADIKHHKILKKNDDTIDDLKRYKTLKQSEERDFKLKEKKLKKKLKSVDERETKIKSTRKGFIKEEIKGNELKTNNNQLEAKFRDSITMTSYNYPSILSTTTTFPSSVSHWIPPTVIPTAFQLPYSFPASLQLFPASLQLSPALPVTSSASFTSNPPTAIAQNNSNKDISVNNNDPATAPSKTTTLAPPTTNLSECSPALTPPWTATASRAPTTSNSTATPSNSISSVASDPEFFKLFSEQLEKTSQGLEKNV